MNRRILLVAAVTAGIALVPAAAHAAQASESSERTSALLAGPSSQGNALVYAVNGPVDNEFITVNVVSTSGELPESAISIAGTASLKKPTADGSASFEVTMEAGGTYTLVATGDDGDLIDSQVVSVDDGTATVVGAAESTPSAAAPAVGATPGLGAALGAGALAVAGAGAVLVASRRRELTSR